MSEYKMYMGGTVLKRTDEGMLHVYRVNPQDPTGVQYVTIANVGDIPNFDTGATTLAGFLVDSNVKYMLHGAKPTEGHIRLGALVGLAAGSLMFGAPFLGLIAGSVLGHYVQTTPKGVDMTPYKAAA
jgi:hypothetical protein